MSAAKDKSIVTKEQAKKMIFVNDNGMVHTFYNLPSLGLIGGDHSKKSVFKDIDNAFACKKTGKQAQAMGHGLAIIPTQASKQENILFVETKES